MSTLLTNIIEEANVSSKEESHLSPRCLVENILDEIDLSNLPAGDLIDLLCELGGNKQEAFQYFTIFDAICLKAKGALRPYLLKKLAA